MKQLINHTAFRYFLITILAIMPNLHFALATDIKTDTVEVSGNCGMCEKRILSAVTVKGVKSAQWDADTQQLVIKYDVEKISLDDIEKRIAKAGHDTPNHKADNATYEALHGCCQYPRK